MEPNRPTGRGPEGQDAAPEGRADALDLEAFEDLLVRVRRQAIIIQRLGTELHALLMVLMQKKLLTLDEVRAAERRLDLAAEIARAREIAAVARDLDALDAELDAGRYDEAA
jgi:hypothetical protein